MIKKIISYLPDYYPEWAIKNAIKGYYLPSDSEEQVQWNIALAKAAQDIFKETLLKRGHIAAWNALNKAERYINAQQTKYFNKGALIAFEVISNLKDALALDDSLDWPEPFVPVYKTRAFWKDQAYRNDIRNLDVKRGFSIFRKAADPRWYLRHQYTQEICPWYFLLGTLTSKRVRLEVTEIPLLECDKSRFLWAFEYTIQSPNREFRGEVICLKKEKRLFWHIPRDMSEVSSWFQPACCRQGDKIFNFISNQPYGCVRNEVDETLFNYSFGRHRPENMPVGMWVDSENDRDIVWEFEKEGVLVKHPEHPTIKLEKIFVRVENVPGYTMYVGPDSYHD